MLLLFLPACGEGGEAELDFRVAHLRNWVSYRPRAGSLFFLDRFETREEDVLRVLPRMWGGRRSGKPDLPAVQISLNEALRVARAFWGRLPTLDEFRFAVRGSMRRGKGWRYPWGDVFTSPLYANTFELGLGKRARVGTFESGRDPSGDSCYDLIGNVSEWVLTPLLQIQLENLHLAESLADDPGRELRDLSHEALFRFGAGRVLGPLHFPLELSPWSYATPFVPELLSGLFEGDIQVCTLGFSFRQFLEQPERREDPDELGTLGRRAGELSDSLGMRMATDPYTFLGALETCPGEPSGPDRGALRAFLLRFPEAFRQAARRRLSLDREFLGLSPRPGAWARHAWEVLGVPW